MITHLKEYKHILNDYNTGKITYQEFIDQTFPIWETISKILDTKQDNR